MQSAESRQEKVNNIRETKKELYELIIYATYEKESEIQSLETYTRTESFCSKIYFY